MGFTFEKLDVYKKSVEFAGAVYETTRDFPESEKFGLTSQLRRAAVSVSANIAEGSGRHHKKDFTQFLRIARGSVYECVPLLEIAHNQEFVGRDRFEDIIVDCNELAKMLNGLIGSLK